MDDTDNLQGFGAGPDFPTVNNGVIEAGYQQAHLGWLILVTASTQTSGNGQTYTDTKVYSKYELRNWLATRYSNSIAALNAAWGSKYTTFGTSGGWGSGGGVLDEDGTCPSRGSTACWVPKDAYLLGGATAQMKQDMDDFLLHHAQKYFSVVKSTLQSVAPGVLYLGPTSLGTWGTPPRRQILQAASQYVDVLVTASLPSMCSNCTDIQQRIDFVSQYGGDKPWVNWEGYWAEADSYMSPYATAGALFTTQAARGQMYQQRMNEFLTSADSGGPTTWWG